MVRTRYQLKNLSKKELIEELIVMQTYRLRYLFSPVVSMIFWDDVKFFLQSYLLVKTVTVC